MYKNEILSLDAEQNSLDSCW